MSHGSPTKQPWSRPALYPLHQRRRRSSWRRHRWQTERREEWSDLMENKAESSGIISERTGIEEEAEKGWLDRHWLICINEVQMSSENKKKGRLHLSFIMLKSGSVNGSHPLLPHISLSLSVSLLLCPSHLSPLFTWQRWQRKMEGRKLCTVGHLEETVWNWNEDDPPTTLSLLKWPSDLFPFSFSPFLPLFHTHIQKPRLLELFKPPVWNFNEQLNAHYSQALVKRVHMMLIKPPGKSLCLSEYPGDFNLVSGLIFPC